MEISSVQARAILLALCISVIGSGLGVVETHAEQGWVRDEIRLNLRTGPSTQNRIVSVIKTGDAVVVLQRGEGWTKVRNQTDGNEGWIPEGYLMPTPPPRIRLAQLEIMAAELESQLAEVSGRATELAETNDVLASQDGEQGALIKALTLENMELKAGARYPEWITGALIFGSGMLLGAILRWSFARRAPSRIRL